MKIGDKIQSKWGRTFIVAGRLYGDVVLSPIDGKDENCVAYCDAEIAELTASGVLVSIK